MVNVAHNQMICLHGCGSTRQFSIPSVSNVRAEGCKFLELHFIRTGLIRSCMQNDGHVDCYRCTLIATDVIEGLKM